MSNRRGLVRLDAYDLGSTRLVIPDDELAMPVCGRAQKLMQTTWLKLAEYAVIQRKGALRIIDDHIKALPESLALVQRSYGYRSPEHQPPRCQRI